MELKLFMKYAETWAIYNTYIINITAYAYAECNFVR